MRQSERHAFASSGAVETHTCLCSPSPFKVYIYEHLPSTNAFLKENQKNFPDYAVVVARAQTAGRGQFGRAWFAAPGRDLCFSVLFPFSAMAEQHRAGIISNLAQAAALAICRWVRSCGLPAQIKWPNDVFLYGKKAAGVLCEVIRRPPVDAAVIGIGLNVNSGPADWVELDRPVASLASVSGRKWFLDDVLRGMLTELKDVLQRLGSGGFQAIQPELAAGLFGVGRPATLKMAADIHEGEITGVDVDGALIFKCRQCGCLKAYSGEVDFELKFSRKGATVGEC